MVLLDSHRVSRVPRYSGATSEMNRFSGTGLTPSMVHLSRKIPLTVHFVTLRSLRNDFKMVPQPPYCNAYGLTQHRFRLFPVRSPLLRESLLISFPPGTEMFQFPGFAFTCLCIQHGMAGFTRRGFPHSDIFGSKLV